MISILSLALTVGCSPRESTKELVATNTTPLKVLAVAIPVSTQDIVEEVTAKPEQFLPEKTQKAVLRVTHKPTIRITAMMKRGNESPRVGVVQDSSGDWRILRLGQSFRGYRLDKIDYEAGKVMLDWNGQSIELLLEGMVEKTVIASPVKDSPPTVAKMVYSDTEFTATADEVARGINPNDATTWPSNYRGPAIERIAQEMDSDFAPITTSNIPVAEEFIPTQVETLRGIDPNDHTTWPKGYRGPMIERIAAETQDSPSAPSPLLDIEPPDGTPEEIKQRFLKKYAPKGDAQSGGISMPVTPTKKPDSASMMMPQMQ